MAAPPLVRTLPSAPRCASGPSTSAASGRRRPRDRGNRVVHGGRDRLRHRKQEGDVALGAAIVIPANVEHRNRVLRGTAAHAIHVPAAAVASAADAMGLRLGKPPSFRHDGLPRHADHLGLPPRPGGRRRPPGKSARRRRAHRRRRRRSAWPTSRRSRTRTTGGCAARRGRPDSRPVRRPADNRRPGERGRHESLSLRPPLPGADRQEPLPLPARRAHGAGGAPAFGPSAAP